MNSSGADYHWRLFIEGPNMFAKGVVNLRKGLLVCLAILMQAWFAAPAHAQAAPTISAISTNRSSTNGGTTVVITGTNFTGATRVYWSGSFNVDMASFTVDSATQITAVTAASGFSGNGAIAVQTPNGTATLFGFQVLPAPTISSVSPSSGPAAGGTQVFINGQGFTDIFSNSVITAVKFGGVNAASFQLQGSTLVAVTAPGTPGQADVQVTTSVGDTATLANSFSYLAPLPTISSVSPSAGPTSGGTSVVITGTNFIGVSQVNFGLFGGGSTPAQSFTVNSATQITAVSPQVSGNAYNATIEVRTASGSVTQTNAFAYAPSPQISSVNPSTGDIGGGTSVTIIGNNFVQGQTTVSFGGVAATSVTVNGTSSLTAVTGPRAAGTVDVVVTTPGGSVTRSSGYTYAVVPPAPTITSVSPSSGPNTGGTVVTVNGTNFVSVQSVGFGLFGPMSVPYTVVSPTQITFTTPSTGGSIGSAFLSIQTAGGSVNLPSAFTYTAAPAVPVISFVSGATGPEAGGTRVSISGSNFTGTTSVTFGGVAALSFSATSNNITAYAPPGTGSVPIVVTNAVGSATASTQFVYTAATAPSIFGLSSSSPPPTGATIAVYGSNLETATGVTIAGTATTFSVVQVSATSFRLEVAVPAGTVNTTVPLVVTTPSGTASINLTYMTASGGAPSISSVSPQSVSTAGGMYITINGANIGNATAVSIGGVAAPAFFQQGASTLVVKVPAGSAGAVPVSVTTPAGTATQQNALTYVVSPVPVISSVTPNFGPASGGTSVILRGSGFTGTTSVSVQGAPATFTVDSDTQISAVTGAAASGGAASFVVVTPGGQATAPFTYQVAGFAAPTVSSIATTSGPTTGGTNVVITGTNFVSSATVTFGGVAARFVVNSATQITATAPAGSAGVVGIGVTTPGGTATLSSAYTYAAPGGAAPTISGVAPNSGPIAGGTSVVITGTNLTGASAVTFGGTAATSFTVDSATQITAVAPAGTAGAVGISVTTAAGTVTSNNAYTYVAPQQAAPTIASIAPSSGPVAGGTSVVITGTNLTGASAVTFAGTAATSFTVNSATQITAVAPAGTAGAASVAVTTAGGTVTLAGAFTYAAAPVISTPGNAAGATTAALALDENQTAIARLTADQTVTWSLDGGSDAASFRIDPATGALAFVNAPDFENPTDSDRNNGYVVRVKAVNAASLATTQTITVTVRDTDEIGRKLAQIGEKLRMGLRSHAVHGLSDMLSFNESLMRAANDDACNKAASKDLSGSINANQAGGQVKLAKRLSECGRRNQVFADLGLTYSKQGGNWNTRMFASLRFEHQLTADLTLGAGLLASRASDSLTGFANSAISDQSLQGTVYGRYRISQRLRTGGFAGYGEGWYDFSLADSDGFLLDGKMTGKRQVYGWMLSGDFNIGQTVITTDAIVSHAKEKLGSATLAARYLGESRSGIGFAVGSVDTTRISVPLTAPIQLSGDEELGRSTRLLLSPGLLCEDNDVQTSALRCGYQVGAKFVVKDGGRNRLYADYRWESVAGLRRALFGLGYAYRFGEKEALELAFEANSGVTSMRGQDNRAMVAVRLAH